jgi:hypothetical protein
MRRLDPVDKKTLFLDKWLGDRSLQAVPESVCTALDANGYGCVVDRNLKDHTGPNYFSWTLRIYGRYGNGQQGSYVEQDVFISVGLVERHQVGRVHEILKRRICTAWENMVLELALREEVWVCP